MPGDNMREAAGRDREKCRPALLANCRCQRRIFVLAPKLIGKYRRYNVSKIYSAGSIYSESSNVIVKICDTNTMKVVNEACDFYNANLRISRDKLII